MDRAHIQAFTKSRLIRSARMDHARFIPQCNVLRIQTYLLLIQIKLQDDWTFLVFLTIPNRKCAVEFHTHNFPNEKWRKLAEKFNSKCIYFANTNVRKVRCSRKCNQNMYSDTLLLLFSHSHRTHSISMYFCISHPSKLFSLVRATTIKMKTTNWNGYIYIPMYSYIIKKGARNIYKNNGWMKHIQNVSGSFAKKALVQTIVCLVLQKYKRKKTDRQTDIHARAHGERERRRERERECEWTSAYFVQRQFSNTQT